MKKRARVRHVGSFAGVVVLAVACSFSHAEGLPNILMISLDTVRADHLGCYGYARRTSTNVDALAAEGVLFEDMVAASSWTSPSHMSLFTGLYPTFHGVQQTKHRLNAKIPTIATILREVGYTTAAFVTGPSLNHKMGFVQGFDIYDDFSISLHCDVNLLAEHDVDASGINQVPTVHVLTRLAQNWLQKNKDRRFFLFLHFWDAHADYIPPPPYDKTFDPAYEGQESGHHISRRREALERSMSARDLAHLVALYDGEIAHVDEYVGKILSALHDLDISQNTIVILTSDHGEEFKEHGRLTHGHSLQQELLHIPLIIRWPEHLPPGIRIKGPVSHVDLLPTLASMLGIECPRPVHGIDLSAFCRQAGHVPVRPVLSEVHLRTHLRSVRIGRHKVIDDVGTAKRAYFDLASDAEEKHPGTDLLDAAIAARMEAVLKEMDRLAGKWREGRGASESDLTKETLRQLKTLGYLE